MVAAMGLFVLNDVLVKNSTGHLTSGQILMLRGVFASLVTVGLLMSARTTLRWANMWQPIVGVRVALEFATALLSVAALSRLPVVTVSAVMMASPLVVVAFSLMAARRGLSAARLSQCAISFIGACLVLRPEWSGGLSGWWTAALLALMLAARDLVTRRMPESVSSEHLTLLVTLSVMVGGALLTLVQDWRPVTAPDAGVLAAAACATSLGNLMLIRACRGTDLTVVAPYRYTAVLWSLFAAMILWSYRPDPLSLLGGTLIVASGIVALRPPAHS
jgi:drug/metabolite transporter (DMT)-like permease